MAASLTPIFVKFTAFFFNIQHNFYCKDTSSPLLSAHKQDLLAGNNLQPKGQLCFLSWIQEAFPSPDQPWGNSSTIQVELLFFAHFPRGQRVQGSRSPASVNQHCSAGWKGPPSGRTEDAPSHPTPSPSSCHGSTRNHLPSLSEEEISPLPGMPGQESVPSWLVQCFNAVEIKQTHELGPKSLLTGILFEKIRFYMCAAQEKTWAGRQ